MSERKLVHQFGPAYIGCFFKLFHEGGTPVMNGDEFELTEIKRAYVGIPATSVFVNRTTPSAHRLTVPHVPGEAITAECLGNPEVPAVAAEPDVEEERVAWGLMMDARDHVLAARERFRSAVLAAAKAMERETGGLFVPTDAEVTVVEVTDLSSSASQYTVADVVVRTVGGIR